MTTSGELRIDRDMSAADEATVIAGLLAFNERWLGPLNEEQVRFVARDDQGVVGGLIGHIRWRWLYVAKLWVDERGRGRGIGTKLLTAAEDLARSRGCNGASLDTFEYQARPFYEKLGYNVFGTLHGYPPGYRQFYLRKDLTERSETTE
jgi:GNAT superfamily N-acetyltransferase